MDRLPGHPCLTNHRGQGLVDGIEIAPRRSVSRAGVLPPTASHRPWCDLASLREKGLRSV